MARIRPCARLPHLLQAKATVGEAEADPLTATQGVCISQLIACRKGIAGGFCRLAAVAGFDWCLCPDTQSLDVRGCHSCSAQCGLPSQVVPRAALHDNYCCTCTTVVHVQLHHVHAVYAIDKAALVAGSQKANTALPGTFVSADDQLLLALQPARQAAECSTPNTYLMAVPISLTGAAVNTLQLFTLQGTETLASQHAHVALDWVERNVQLDVVLSQAPPASQKTTDIPFASFLNFQSPTVYNISTPSLLNTGAGFIESLSFVDDKLGASSVPTEGGSPVAGIAWAVVDPHRPAKAMRSALLRAPGNNHLLFPYMAVRPGGQGVVSLSMSGPDMHPSPAYAVLSKEGLGQLTVITPGVGVLESLSGYN
mgnify:CR=1 FL=1